MTDNPSMGTLLLINPNTSVRSLAMMLDSATPHLPPGVTLRGVGAAHGVAMIVNEADLRASAAEVSRLALANAADVSAVIVAAFGDPGVETLRSEIDIPVVGIGEASLAEASSGGRRFGIATTTQGLARAIERMVEQRSLGALFAGVRVPDCDPLALAADPSAQEQALARTVRDCITLDGAEAVVIGGGPLSEAARALRGQFAVEIVEPVPAAVRAAVRMLRFET
jgi:allantoin racemase